MRALLLALFLLLLLPSLLHAQGATPVGTANGRIQLVVLDASQQPVSGVRAGFVSEAQDVLATCTTDPRGRCTLLVANAPADASGFIRGSVVIEDRGFGLSSAEGRKPLLWPGGEIEVEVVLDEAGQLEIPYDLYPTRTPNASEVAAGTPAVSGTAVITSQSADASPTPQPEPTPSPTVSITAPAQSTATAGAPGTTPTPTHVVLTSASRSPDWMLLAGAGLLLLVALYVVLGRRSQGGAT